MLVVFGGRNVARDENASHLGTHFRLWLEGGVENLLTPPRGYLGTLVVFW